MITDSKYTVKNSFLSRAVAALRKSRLFMPMDYHNSIRIERVDGLPFVNIWFRTRGCSYDYQGACTMCNYGVSSLATAEEMIEAVRSGLELVGEEDTGILLITPSGSMFDDMEVPAAAREGIFHLVRQSRCVSYLCETRAETLTEENVRRYAEILDNKNASIEVGLESSNPWVLKYCVNKILSLEDYRNAMQLLKKYHLGSSTTIMLGNCFLSPKEAIEDTIASVRWAFANGTDRVCIFPAHVKSTTLIEWLWRRSLYSPPSLWSLVEVLARLGPELSPRIYIAWYKNYYKEAGVSDKSPIANVVPVSPSTCPRCEPKVLELLEAYRDMHNYAVVEALMGLECECKQTWRATLEIEEELPLHIRAAHFYETIGRGVLPPGWWEQHRDGVIRGIEPMRGWSY